MAQIVDHFGWGLIGIVATLVHLAGLVLAAHAILRTRTSQGAIAWAMGLVLLPWLVVPLYLIFGRSKFYGYVESRRAEDRELRQIVEELTSFLPSRQPDTCAATDLRGLEAIARVPLTRGNQVQLLIDGEATFSAIFAGIDAAQHYIVVQFFIVHADVLGCELQRRLIEQARRGRKVFFLYDEIGSHSLPRAYLAALRAAGVEVRKFGSRRGITNRFQVNFRNHRKIVVVDGHEAYVGGHNVGDEYLGKNKFFGRWRDTHVKVTGPAVQAIQLAFLEDWYWASGQVAPLNWQPIPASGSDLSTLVVRSGPADDVETCGLFFTHAINMARRRVWISSPYLVPDLGLVAAIQLAALRGVDVKILLPDRADHLLVYLAGFTYVDELASLGVEFYRYQGGFLHQKALLVDDALACIGTANFDNRSVRLNFEITVAVIDPHFNTQVEHMLKADLAESRLCPPDELASKSLGFRLAARLARLTAPVL